MNGTSVVLEPEMRAFVQEWRRADEAALKRVLASMDEIVVRVLREINEPLLDAARDVAHA